MCINICITICEYIAISTLFCQTQVLGEGTSAYANLTKILQKTMVNWPLAMSQRGDSGIIVNDSMKMKMGSTPPHATILSTGKALLVEFY